MLNTRALLAIWTLLIGSMLGAAQIARAASFVSAPQTGAADLANASFVNVYLFPNPNQQDWNTHIAALVATGLSPTLTDYTKEAIDNFTAALVASDYFSFLGPSYGISPPKFAGGLSAAPQCAALLSNQVTINGQLTLKSNLFSDFVGCEERSGSLPANSFINIIVSPEFDVGEPFGSPQMCANGQFSGYHSFTNGNIDSYDSLNGYFFTVIPANIQCNQSFSGLVADLSHEIIETISDPDGLGWIHETVPGRFFGGIAWVGQVTDQYNNGEIGDICENSANQPPTASSSVSSTMPFLKGLVARYWSNNDNACVPQFDQPPFTFPISFSGPFLAATSSASPAVSTFEADGNGFAAYLPLLSTPTMLSSAYFEFTDLNTGASAGNNIGGSGKEPPVTVTVSNTQISGSAPISATEGQLALWSPHTGQIISDPPYTPVPSHLGFDISPHPTLRQNVKIDGHIADQNGYLYAIVTSVLLSGSVSPPPSILTSGYFEISFVPALPGRYNLTATTTPTSSSSRVVTGSTTIPIPPIVASISPSFVNTDGTTAITITGDGLSTNPTVSFGGMLASSLTVSSATRLVATAPSSAGTANSVDVDVVAGGVLSETVGSVQYFTPYTPVVKPQSDCDALWLSALVIDSNNNPIPNAAMNFIIGSYSVPGATTPSGGAAEVMIPYSKIPANSSRTGLSQFIHGNKTYSAPFVFDARPIFTACSSRPSRLGPAGQGNIFNHPICLACNLVDIPASDVRKRYIDDLVAVGALVVVGGRFFPNAPVSQAEFQQTINTVTTPFSSALGRIPGGAIPNTRGARTVPVTLGAAAAYVVQVAQLPHVARSSTPLNMLLRGGYLGGPGQENASADAPLTRIELVDLAWHLLDSKYRQKMN